MDQMHVQSNISVNVWLSLKMNDLRDWIQNTHIPFLTGSQHLIIEQISACAEFILKLNNIIIILVMFWKVCEIALSDIPGWSFTTCVAQGKMCLYVVTVKCCFLSELNSIPGWMTLLYPHVCQMCRHNTDTLCLCVCACDRALRAFILT